MRTIHRYLATAATAFVFILAPSLASAITINNGASSLFYDGFEGVTAPVPVDGRTPPVGGNWVHTGTAATGTIVDIPAAANEGVNYLRINRTGGSPDKFDSPFTLQTSGTVKNSFAFRAISAGSDWAMHAYFADSANSIIGGMLITNTGEVRFEDAGFVRNDSGFDVTIGSTVWNTAEIAYNIETGLLSLAINGGTPATFSSTSGLQPDKFRFSAVQEGVTNDIDAVPEPSGIIMLAIGVIGATGTIWRRRRENRS